MRAVFIKTDAAAVEEVEFDGGLDHAYRMLMIDKNGSHLVQIFTLEKLGLAGDGCLMVDEEGLLRPATMRMGSFLIGTFPQRLHGRGLIVGVKMRADGGAQDWDHSPVSAVAVRRRLLFF